jgi:hypothetical protein
MTLEFPILRSLVTRVPVVTALIVQVVALGVVLGLLSRPLASLPSPWSGYALLVAWGLLAALGTVLLLRSAWWWPIQVAVPWLIALGVRAEIPPWIWLVALVGSLVVFGGGIFTRVPLYLSNPAAWQALSALATPGCRAVDLGAGFGGPMRALARAHPTGQFLSVEASPVTALVCAVLALPYRRVRVRWGSLWSQSLAEMDLVYVFLSPAPMERLWAKVRAEMRPGSLVVSNTFPIPGVEPHQVIPLTGRTDARLFVYRV